jgi:hypothetical protein
MRSDEADPLCMSVPPFVRWAVVKTTPIASATKAAMDNVFISAPPTVVAIMVSFYDALIWRRET